MKILHIIDSEGLYGAEVMILNLALEQKKIGLQPIILNMRESNSFENSLEGEASRNAIDFHIIPTRTGPDFTGAFKITHFANTVGVDLIHSHGYKPNILMGFIPRRARRLPIVTTIHGWTYTGGNTRMRLYEWFDAYSLKFIDAVVIVNKAMLSNSRLNKLDRKKVFVVNNGIPSSDWAKPSHLSNSGTSSPQKLDHNIIDFCKRVYTIGSIGRLSPEKGYSCLIEALNFLVKEGFDIHLIIIGEGYERNSLKALVAQFELSDRVMLAGYLNDAKNYLPYFNLFALSSLTEGLPITLLEAMQEKVPIIATKVGGIPEVLQDGKGGLLVNTGSSKNLAEAISSIYHNPNLAADLASVSYQEVITKYTSENMALGYLDIYLEVTRHRQLI
jgi:glycosyltransferase involved in cell wall biosynthesis